MGAPGITAGTHRSSKKPSVSEKSSQIDLWFFIILILKNFPPKKFPEQKLVIIPFFEKTARRILRAVLVQRPKETGHSDQLLQK